MLCFPYAPITGQPEGFWRTNNLARQLLGQTAVRGALGQSTMQARSSNSNGGTLPMKPNLVVETLRTATVALLIGAVVGVIGLSTAHADKGGIPGEVEAHEIVNGYSFTIVYEKSLPGRPGAPSINSSSAIAFFDRGVGIRVVDGDNSRLIEPKEDDQNIYGQNSAVINDAGFVAYYFQKKNCDQPTQSCGGIILNDGRRREIVVDPNDPLVPGSQISEPTLNNRRDVAFGLNDRVNRAAYVYVISRKDTQILGPNLGGPFAISDSGHVLLSAVTPEPPYQWSFVLFAKGELTSVASFDLSKVGFGSAAMNNAGKVVFCTNPSAGGETQGMLYSWENGRLEQIAPISRCGAVAINDSGQVVVSTYDELLTLEEGRLVRILRAGDHLFGRTVEGFEFGRFNSGLNDSGQLALNVSFSDSHVILVSRVELH